VSTIGCPVAVGKLLFLGENAVGSDHPPPTHPNDGRLISQMNDSGENLEVSSAFAGRYFDANAGMATRTYTEEAVVKVLSRRRSFVARKRTDESAGEYGYCLSATRHSLSVPFS
jgi:hypothetical protein